MFSALKTPPPKRKRGKVRGLKRIKVSCTYFPGVKFDCFACFVAFVGNDKTTVKYVVKAV
jgi:hypothetical protein